MLSVITPASVYGAISKIWSVTCAGVGICPSIQTLGADMIVISARVSSSPKAAERIVARSNDSVTLALAPSAVVQSLWRFTTLCSLIVAAKVWCSIEPLGISHITLFDPLWRATKL